MSRPTLVLSWEQHDAQHRSDERSYGVGVTPRRTYVLDASDRPPLLWCRRCRRYVIERETAP